MYIDKNIIYSEPGKYLEYKKGNAFQVPFQDGVIEHDLCVNDLYIKDNFAYYNNKLFVQYIDPTWTYGDYKKSIITSRYSNDDQIAIILNKDDSEEDKQRYDRMMK